MAAHDSFASSGPSSGSNIYPARPNDSIPTFRVDRYARVTFDWDDREARFTNPKATRMTSEDVEALVGQRLGGKPLAPRGTDRAIGPGEPHTGRSRSESNLSRSSADSSPLKAVSPR
jgi:hypothetical protein